jgi:hypothetical protein
MHVERVVKKLFADMLHDVRYKAVIRCRGLDEEGRKMSGSVAWSTNLDRDEYLSVSNILASAAACLFIGHMMYYVCVGEGELDPSQLLGEVGGYVVQPWVAGTAHYKKEGPIVDEGSGTRPGQSQPGSSPPKNGMCNSKVKFVSRFSFVY